LSFYGALSSDREKKNQGLEAGMACTNISLIVGEFVAPVLTILNFGELKVLDPALVTCPLW
jgi:hypothetical protein